MRCPRWSLAIRATLSLVLLAAVTPASAGPEGSRAPTREESIVRWALSYAPVTEDLRQRVREIARSGAADAEARLMEIGEPARRALLALVPVDTEVARVATPWLARMQDLENEVERRGLAQNVGTLAVLGADGAARVARLVPAEARGHVPAGLTLSESLLGDRAAWCEERAGSLRYLPATDRLVLREPWERDQAPLRMRGRSKLELAGTERLVGLNSPVTLEMWVRTLGRQQCYLATDEAWPGMSPEVPTAVKAGLALRRNMRGTVTSTLELTCGVAPNGWWTIESAPLRVGRRSKAAQGSDVARGFEHVAVTSDGKVVRLFRDGELVAARAIDGARFARGVGELCVGVRRHAYSDRVTGMDVRGFRLSEGALYTEDFVPQQRLEKTDATLVLLDFSPSPTVDGRTALRDLSPSQHDGAAEGALFVPVLDGIQIRADLAALGGGAGEVIIAEAEDGGGTEHWSVVSRDNRSGGSSAEIYSNIDPGAEGHALAVPFRLPRTGTWRTFVVGAGLERGPHGVSPFAWQVDDGPWTPVLRPLPTLSAIGGDPQLDLSPLGVSALTAGEHVFRMRLLAPRQGRDRRWSIWVDAIAFEAVP